MLVTMGNWPKHGGDKASKLHQTCTLVGFWATTGPSEHLTAL